MSMNGQCSAIRRSGQPCTRGPVVDGLCRVHLPEYRAQQAVIGRREHLRWEFAEVLNPRRPTWSQELLEHVRAGGVVVWR